MMLLAGSFIGNSPAPNVALWLCHPARITKGKPSAFQIHAIVPQLHPLQHLLAASVPPTTWSPVGLRDANVVKTI